MFAQDADTWHNQKWLRVKTEVGSRSGLLGDFWVVMVFDLGPRLTGLGRDPWAAGGLVGLQEFGLDWVTSHGFSIRGAKRGCGKRS